MMKATAIHVILLVFLINEIQRALLIQTNRLFEVWN